MIDPPQLDTPSFCLHPIPPVALAACALIAATSLLAASASAAPAQKVEVCHIPSGNPDNFHTITISENALAAHLAHGDVTGSCNAICDLLCSDNNRCTIDHNGNCEESGCLPPNERPQVNCDDGDICTEDEICDPIDGCANEPRPGNSCNDGDACTDGDVCDESGECAGDKIDNCCIYVGDCDDGDLCTNDFCDGVPENPSGTCSHADVECEDPDACTSLNCNPADGSCTIETPIVCDDGFGCTNDSCDPASGCASDPIECQPSNACQTSSCVEPGMCMDAPLECADDGVACTTESCDPITGCNSVANDAACNDGDRCTRDKCDPSSPFADGCRHDPLPGCCNSDADCPTGEQCNESAPIPRCEPAQPAVGCPCWDGSATSVNGVSNVVELWTLYGPTTCSTDRCQDRDLTGSGSVKLTEAACDTATGQGHLTSEVRYDPNVGGVYCLVQGFGQSQSIYAFEVFLASSPEAEACMDEHDALITLGGTFPNYFTNSCGLASF